MSHPYEKRPMRVLDHIHANPAGDLSLDALAEVAAMSRFHWHRVFRAMTGETAAQTVRRKRMHRVAVSLVSRTESLAAIARSVGYPSLASFSRFFAETYGTTPSAVRKRGDLRPFLPTLGTGVLLMYPVTIRTDPTRRLAAVPHKGTYAGLPAAYDQLYSVWLPKSGEEPANSPPFEIYLNTPMDTPQADLVTEICMLLQN